MRWTILEKRRAQLHAHGIRISRKHVGKSSTLGWYAIQRDLRDRMAPRVVSGPHKNVLTAVGYGERLLVERREREKTALLCEA